MKPYFLDSVTGIALVIAFCVVTAGIEATGLFRSRAGATNRDRGSGLVLRLALVPAIVLMALSPKFAPGAEIKPPVVSLVVGLVVLAAGEGIRIWARKTLGRYFTYEVQTSGDQPVIQTGPYRFVRHPSYAGILLILVGFGFIWGNWVGLAIATVVTFASVGYRIQVEEQALVTELGDAYREFAGTHKRLVPYVW